MPLAAVLFFLGISHLLSWILVMRPISTSKEGVRLETSSRNGRAANQTVRDRLRASSDGIATANKALETLGPLFKRAFVGDRPRGLLAAWFGLGVLSARSCALKSLPLGRRRLRWNLRSAAVHLFCTVTVEWSGSSSKRADVRFNRPTG